MFVYECIHTLMCVCVCVCVCACVSRSVVSDFATPWTVALQAPLSMGFSRQEYWSGLPFLPPRESDQPRDRTSLSCLAAGFFTTEPPGNPAEAQALLSTLVSENVECNVLVFFPFQK